MTTYFWSCLLAGLLVILIIMLIMMFRKKTLLDKLNYVFAMNTVIVLLILAELFFFACVITHVVVSLTKGLITLGLLSSQKVQKMIDRILYVAGAVVFFVSAFAVIRGQAAMFLH